MTDCLNFTSGNNACLSLRILAERVRAGDAKIIISHVRETGVLELKVSGSFVLENSPTPERG
jgi:hypothetical protein